MYITEMKTPPETPPLDHLDTAALAALLGQVVARLFAPPPAPAPARVGPPAAQAGTRTQSDDARGVSPCVYSMELLLPRPGVYLGGWKLKTARRRGLEFPGMYITEMKTPPETPAGRSSPAYRAGAITKSHEFPHLYIREMTTPPETPLDHLDADGQVVARLLPRAAPLAPQSAGPVCTA
jgi:hypothetical protein